MKNISLLFILSLIICLIPTSSCHRKNTSKLTSKTRSFIDPRDGETYQLIAIEDQIWFAENLRYNAEGSWYNSNNPNEKYGRLYDWQTSLTACPDGWHLPNDAEWNTLEIALGMATTDTSVLQYRGFHGTNMKSQTGWINDSNGDNSSGFNAFPTGYYYSGQFRNLGKSTGFWTTTPYDTIYAWDRTLGHANAGVDRNADYKIHGFPCRCLQDYE